MDEAIQNSNRPTILQSANDFSIQKPQTDDNTSELDDHFKSAEE